MAIETVYIHVLGDLRGEQSVGPGRTIRWLGANNPTPGCGKHAQNQLYIQFIGRKRRHDSQPSPRGRFSTGGGRCVWDNTLIFTVLRVKVAVGVSKGPYESHMRTPILVGWGGGCGTGGEVSKINKMSIERRCRRQSGRANNPLARGEQTVRSGRTIRWLGANNPTPGLRKTRPKPIIYSIYRAQEVYPLSPLLGGGFPKEGGDACSTVNSFCIGGGCAASAKVSKWAKIIKCQ